MPVASTWSLPGRPLDLRSGVLVGVLNTTPDSFSDGGAHTDVDEALAHVCHMIEEGAAVIDVGGESTRPGAEPVSVESETSRVVPVVAGIAALNVPVSVDTYKSEVAVAAIEVGASIVNDVTGFSEPGMREVAAAHRCGVVVMHGRESPLASAPPGSDVVSEVESYLLRRVEDLVGAGVDPGRIAIDPGLGFAKRPAQSLRLLGGLGRLAAHGLPVMVGASRKGFITEVSGAATLEDRDNVTSVITALAYTSGVRLFRVHDVARSRGALRMADAIVASQ